jgi:hypothetical protein
MSTIPSGSLPTRSRGGFSGREAHVVYRREANLWRTGRVDPGIFPQLASWHWLALQSSERAARRGSAVFVDEPRRHSAVPQPVPEPLLRGSVHSVKVSGSRRFA